MAATTLERIQAPSGGMDTDSSPDYVGNMQAPLVQNFLTGRPGKLTMRGALTSGVNVTGTTTSPALAVWTHNDVALIKSTDSGGIKTWILGTVFTTKTDITATLVKVIANSRYTRYGSYVYGAVEDTDAILNPASNVGMARWAGDQTALVLQTNAPYGFVDLQVYAQRLFTLGGSVPGTRTPTLGRTLHYSDPNPDADLSLLASWQDDVSGLTNQITYDGDDTPVALASCGKYMAILGTRSVNLLTGTGSSNFAVRNLTRGLGCIDVESVVEVDDGFWFMSDRGLMFCDGSSVVPASAGVNEAVVDNATNWAAAFRHGYIALAQTGYTWLLHVPTRTWSRLTSGCFPGTSPLSVHRSLTYPLIWDGRAMWVANNITTWAANGGSDSGAGISATMIPARLKTRIARLASPASTAAIKRIIVDSTLGDSLGTWAVTVRDGHDTSLFTGTAPGQAAGSTRNRAQFEGFGETSTAYLDIAYAPTGTPTLDAAELYDMWLEFQPGRDEPGF